MRAALAAALAVSLPALAAAADKCPTNRVPPLVMPHLRAALQSNQEITVVALGSSSTQGVHASDIGHSYPAVLQQVLNQALPGAHVAVLNRGIGGQDVAEELPRIERDVIGVRPVMVIWQVGANGAMRHMSPDLFKRLLMTGVQRLREAKIDVILMDNQRAPSILAAPDHGRFDQAMADVAVATGSALFGRGALMDQWRNDGAPYTLFMSEDGVHHNDFGYRCVAQALGQALVDGIGGLPGATPPANAVAARQ